jgi:hypothetical protein
VSFRQGCAAEKKEKKAKKLQKSGVFCLTGFFGYFTQNGRFFEYCQTCL